MRDIVVTFVLCRHLSLPVRLLLLLSSTHLLTRLDYSEMHALRRHGGPHSRTVEAGNGSRRQTGSSNSSFRRRFSVFVLEMFNLKEERTEAWSFTRCPCCPMNVLCRKLLKAEKKHGSAAKGWHVKSSLVSCSVPSSIKLHVDNARTNARKLL